MPRKKKQSSEAAVREIRRRTRRRFSAEEKVRVVLEGLRGEESIAELCRREGIASNLYYRWSKDFLEAGKKRLNGDMVREATSGEVKFLRSENRELKEVVAEMMLKNRLLSDNGPAYVSKELREYLAERGMMHTRGRPYHPQTQGKIERYHRSMKNVVKLEHYHFPWQLEQAIGDFVAYYNHERYHESLENVTPLDVYSGRYREVLSERKRIKRLTMQRRKREYRAAKAA